VLLQFLSSNKYKPKDTLKAMAEHVEFKREFIPSVRLELIEPMLVALSEYRNQVFTTPAVWTDSSVPSSCLG
jgi:hypothetical protein